MRNPLAALFRTAVCAALAAVPLSAQAPSSGAPSDVAALTAHDAHQGLLVAADPYVPVTRYKAKFGKRSPDEAGVVAIDVYFRNDSESPIRLNLDTVVLLISAPGESKQKLEPLAPEDVADMVILKNRPDPTTKRRLPLPLPAGVPKSGKGKAWDEFAGTLRSAAMPTDVLPPHATVHGFFYFDIDHHYDWLSNARLDVPDLVFMLDKKALIFFDVDLSLAKT